ncbi:tubulin--tyrosine ligase-like protein 12 [Macrosteles quadrilineatus]|uniref:tubulin--tyrosine ligase-like protein 12 n=1 Tax=Macrosteles quadrilineatus TaxID=74068 RepID=UPI0023E2B2CF|nr:tubulin--tyrosine ligase-like protein 12 [Macrosteles quadrilineatus]
MSVEEHIASIDNERPIINEVFDVDDSNYHLFLEQHEFQLKSNNIPEHFWKALCLKLENQVFDAGNAFSMLYVEPEDETDEATLKVVVSIDSIDPSDGNNIFLIDHAWTYRASEAVTHLQTIPGLLERMAKLMNVPIESENTMDCVFDRMWKFNLTYSLPSLNSVEDKLPIWYIMDEFGSSIKHSSNPNFRIVPFLHIPEGIAYSLLFPNEIVTKGDEVTRDYVEGITDEAYKRAHLLPWIHHSFRDVSFYQTEPQEEYFISGRTNETLPNLNALVTKNTNGEATNLRPLKVFSQYIYVNEYLTSPKFIVVAEEEDADILWLTSHFKKYKELSENCPFKFINQFPFECVITIKDLLAVICRRTSTNDTQDIVTTLGSRSVEDAQPAWLPVTYNLSTELQQFISCFQHREDNRFDNHWICKPWNLARGMDTLITDNLDCIIRISRSGPKIAQKYIENPVLFYRDGIGHVKFDVRYVILLKSVHPLELYVYKNFFLRFSNKPFEMNDFHDYEKHFTVMNYNENATLHRLLCSDFIREFNIQYPDNQWSQVEPTIFSMMKDIFEAASNKNPPCGIGKSPQSRALYAADLMLATNGDQQFQPKILEINWTPDCQRACEYYPDFYNDIFELLFLDEEKDVFHKVV